MGRPVLLLLALIAACRSQPVEVDPLPQSSAEAPRPGTRFALVEASLRKRYGPYRSGFLPLPNNPDALAWRLALVDHAEQTLDLQVFSWENDDAGALLLERVLAAADRGVKVRMILDDRSFPGGGKGIAALDGHPSIEVRIFNPWEFEGGSAAANEYPVFDRLRFRMHNKLMVADNRICIVGGRDVGNDSFGLARGFNFLDLDLLACGPVARQASGSFDAYWNSPLVAAAPTLKRPSPGLLEKHRRTLRKRIAKSKRLAGHPREPRDWSDRIDPLVGELVAGVGIRIPAARKLKYLLGETRAEALLVLAYFLPDEESVDAIRDAVGRGIKVRILTNSLGSNDAPATIGGLDRWRERILKTGAELYELRHDAAIRSTVAAPPHKGKFVGLHLQAVILDSRHLYVGSLHVAPADLENGILVRDSPELAQQVRGELLPLFAPENAWRTRLDKSGKLFWVSSRGRVTRPPVRSIGQRLAHWLARLLPREGGG